MDTRKRGTVGTAAGNARHAALRAWLDKHNARWHNEGRYGTADLEGYLINGHVVYVLHMPDNSGWDLLMPVSDTNNIEATLRAAEDACGVPQSHGGNYALPKMRTR